MNNRTALFTVFLVVLVDLIGFGIILPLLPFYAKQFHASPVMIGFLFSIYSLAQFFVSPLWGQKSDQIGRRPVMLISTAGSALSYGLFAIANSLELLLFSRFLAGIMAGNIAAAQSYVADVTSEDNRAKGMGLIGAAFGIGFLLGPALATLLVHPAFIKSVAIVGGTELGAYLEAHPYTAPGICAASVSALSFILIFFKLPESRSREERVLHEARALPLVLDKEFWAKVWSGKFGREGEGRRASRILFWLIISCSMLSFGQSSLYGVFPLFCQARFQLTPKDVGMLYVGMGFVAVLVQGGLIRFLLRIFKENVLFLGGSILMVAGLAMLPFMPTVQLMALVLMMMTLGVSLSGPTLNSLISKEARPERMGATLGASQGMAGLGRVLGPTWGGWLYVLAPAAPFVATATVTSLTIGIGGLLLMHRPRFARINVS